MRCQWGLQGSPHNVTFNGQCTAIMESTRMFGVVRQLDAKPSASH